MSPVSCGGRTEIHKPTNALSRNMFRCGRRTAVPLPLTPPLVAGLDLGSTSLKLLVADASGTEVVVRQLTTPWRSGTGGTTEMVATDLLRAVRRLLDETSQCLARVTGDRVHAVAISGMGESGLLIDDHDRPAAPAIAWFDPRGAREAGEFPASVRAQFGGRTGLPLGAQATVAKLAHLRDAGLPLARLRWLNLPEFVAMSLGGVVALEPSLTSRTGLVDQDTGRPWPAMLDALGVEERFLPGRLDVGTSWGRAVHGVPAALLGAELTVAGHDHLVSLGGSLPPDRYHVSLGTAEVLLRVIDAPLGYEARTRLTGQLINEVRHVVPGQHVLVAGVKTGLLLRRVLQSVGVHDRPGRDRLDAEVLALPYEGALPPGGIDVAGARNDDGHLRVTVRSDGVSPAELFAAVLRHSNDEIVRLIAALDAELPPATSSTLTGGWAGMRSVQRARARVLPRLSVSTRVQETAYGAALTAARLLETTVTASDWTRT
jgi:sugar (pentulose or hexulose) kinase